VSLTQGSYRKSYTLKLESILRLSILAAWQNRTVSQQVDQAIQDAFQAHWDQCSPEQRKAIENEFNELMEI